MSGIFQSPPTFADPIIVNEKIPEGQKGRVQFNPIWLKWFLDLTASMSSSGGGSGTVTSVGITGNDGIAVGGTNPVVGSGTITLGLTDGAIPNGKLDTDFVAFNPALSLNGSTTGITYGSRGGRAWKIGTRVFFDCWFTLSSKGAEVGAALVSGLPYTIANQVLPSFSVGYATAFAAGIACLMASGNANGTTLTLGKFAAGTYTILADSDFTNTSSIYISGHYEY